MSNENWDKALRATNRFDQIGSRGGYFVWRSKKVIQGYLSKRFGRVTMGIDLVEDEHQKDTFFWVKSLHLKEVDPNHLARLYALGLFKYVEGDDGNDSEVIQ
jgi:hypothetical protein